MIKEITIGRIERLNLNDLLPCTMVDNGTALHSSIMSVYHRKLANKCRRAGLKNGERYCSQRVEEYDKVIKSETGLDAFEFLEEYGKVLYIISGLGWQSVYNGVTSSLSKFTLEQIEEMGK